MEFLIKVEETFYLEKEGFVVVGNNPEWTIEDCSKMNIKGKSIVVRTTEGEYSFEVEDLNISISLAGKPNFGLTLKESDNFKKISKGDMVFKF
jgi:hypothetical protein